MAPFPAGLQLMLNHAPLKLVPFGDKTEARSAKSRIAFGVSDPVWEKGSLAATAAGAFLQKNWAFSVRSGNYY
jgi:hypothetical protein